MSVPNLHGILAGGLALDRSKPLRLGHEETEMMRSYCHGMIYGPSTHDAGCRSWRLRQDLSRGVVS